MLKKVSLLAGLPVSISVAAIFLLFLLQPRIPLGSLAGPMSKMLTHLTGHEQQITGRLYLVPGPWLSLSLEKARFFLQGDDDYHLKGDVRSAEGRIHLRSLLTGKLILDGINVNGVGLVLKPGKEKSDQGKKEPNDFHRKLLPFKEYRTGSAAFSDIDITIRRYSGRSPVNTGAVSEEKSSDDELMFQLGSVTSDWTSC